MMSSLHIFLFYGFRMIWKWLPVIGNREPEVMVYFWVSDRCEFTCQLNYNLHGSKNVLQRRRDSGCAKFGYCAPFRQGQQCKLVYLVCEYFYYIVIDSQYG